MAPIFIVTPAWLAGIFIMGWLGVAAFWLWLGAGLSFALLVFALVSNRRHYFEPQKYLSLVLPLIILMFCLGGLRLWWSQPSTGADGLLYYVGAKPVKLIGVVSGEPNYTQRSGSFRLNVRELYPNSVAPDKVAVSGEVFVRSRADLRLEMGDLVELSGKLELPQEISGDGFPYRDYLAKQGIYVTMNFPQAKLLDVRQAHFVIQILNDLRRNARNIILSYLSNEEGDVLAGILLGDTRDIDPETKQAFRDTSTSHIVAISGANISIAITMVILLMVDLFKVRRNRALLIALVIVIGYVIMVGATPSVVRAGIMGVLVIIGWLLGREYAALSGLCGAALLMTVFNPNTLWDIGFQLSFMATLGLVVIARPMQNLAFIRNLPPFVQEGLVLTLAAEVMTLPLTIFYFQKFSIVSLAANLLAVPALPLIMLTGALLLGAGWVFGWLGWLVAGFGWAAWVFLAYMIGVVKWFAALPFASVTLPPLHPVWLVYYYGALGLFLWYKQDEQKRLKRWLGELAGKPFAIGGIIIVNLAIWLLVILI
jgi:competence protein ComEC